MTGKEVGLGCVNVSMWLFCDVRRPERQNFDRSIEKSLRKIRFVVSSASPPVRTVAGEVAWLSYRAAML